MSKKSKLTFLFIISLLGGLPAQAQSSTESAATPSNGSQISTTLTESAKPEEATKPYTVALALSKSRSLFITGNGADGESFDGALSGSYKFSDNMKLGLLIERGLDQKTGEADWGRVQFSNSFKEIDTTYATISPRVSLGLPASKLDRSTSLRARVGASAKMAIKTKFPSVSLDYTPSLGYANFAYTTNEFTGNPNSPLSLSQSLGAGYAFNDKVSVKISVLHLLQQTTSGFVKEAWTHSEELGWQVADHWALALGHQFGVPFALTRQANQDLNLAFINEKDSVIYTQLTVDF